MGRYVWWCRTDCTTFQWRNYERFRHDEGVSEMMTREEFAKEFQKFNNKLSVWKVALNDKKLFHIHMDISLIILATCG